MCPSRRRDGGGSTDWGRVADGIGLAGFGIFFLLATTRGLPPGFWLDALSMWPVLLVSAGIRIIFEKSPLPWGVVLGPLIVLGTLGWIAWGHPPAASPPGPWRAVSASRPPGLEQVRLEVRGVGSRLDVESRALPPSELAEGRVAARGDAGGLVERHGESVTSLRIEGEHGGAIFVPGRKSVWELAMADDVPMEIALDAIMTRAVFHLERGAVTRVDAHGPFQSVELRLPPPSLPEPVRIELKGPFCAFHVVVPEGTSVRLEKSVPFAVVMRGPARDDAPKEGPGYVVSVVGPFGIATIDEEPLPEGVVPRPIAPAPETARPPAEAPPEAPPAEVPAPEATF